MSGAGRFTAGGPTATTTDELNRLHWQNVALKSENERLRRLSQERAAEILRLADIIERTVKR